MPIIRLKKKIREGIRLRNRNMMQITLIDFRIFFGPPVEIT